MVEVGRTSSKMERPEIMGVVGWTSGGGSSGTRRGGKIAHERRVAGYDEELGTRSWRGDSRDMLFQATATTGLSPEFQER